MLFRWSIQLLLRFFRVFSPFLQGTNSQGHSISGGGPYGDPHVFDIEIMIFML